MSCVRARIASALLGPPRGGVVGDITLRPHQQLAAERLEHLLRRNGGALLADATGLGKTYVALALARRFEHVIIAAPAALREMWQHALTRTHSRARFVSLEWLSRQRSTVRPGRCDLVIVDEAHHLRTPTTRCYAAVAELTRRASVLLLSATPVQNRRADLLAQLALFLGRRAYTLSDHEAAAHMVRRDLAPDDARLPAIDGPHWIELDVQDDDCLDALLALPRSVPAGDEGDAGVLAVYTLARQWASSRAALTGALRRRLARATAFEATLSAGHLPTRRELAAWTYAEGAMQLAFAELLAPATDWETGSVGTLELLASIRAHAAGIRALLQRLSASSDVDEARVRALRRLRDRYGDARIIAFSQFAETVRALAGRLARDPGVAQLTASGARVAGGRITRREVLAQFSGTARLPAPASERITMLLTTDVLSEGLDLHDASVIVHLDLPWNPARLEQRVGRLRRLGSRHPVVSVHALSPPAAPERLLRLEQRLREKLLITGRLVGIAPGTLPLAGVRADPSAAEYVNAISTTLGRWAAAPRASEPRGVPGGASGHDPAAMLVAAVSASQRGWLALVQEVNGPMLVASLGAAPETHGATLARAMSLADGPTAAPDPGEVASALKDLRSWCSARRGRTSIALDVTSEVKRLAATRIAACVQRAPRPQRANVARLAARARELLDQSLGAGAERLLRTLLDSSSDDEQWLESMAAFAATHRREGMPPIASPSGQEDSSGVRALILLQCTSGCPMREPSAIGQDSPIQDPPCVAAGASAAARTRVTSSRVDGPTPKAIPPDRS